MKILDPGHHYLAEIYKAKEDGKPKQSWHPRIYMKRIGEDYPGNEGGPHDGTNCQEDLRILIDRVQYLNNQKTCEQNSQIITLLRGAIFLFEERAAERRGESKDDFFRRTRAAGCTTANIETFAPCKICGHILCMVHAK